jgi:hypothetical protein
VPLLPARAQLSHSEKDALIAALTAGLALADERIAAQGAHIAAQNVRIAALEARLSELTRPPKTPGNSSKPPSQGQKQDLPEPGTDRPPRKACPCEGGEPPRRWPDAASEPGSGRKANRCCIKRSARSHNRSAADHLPQVRGGVPRRVANPAAGL